MSAKKADLAGFLEALSDLMKDWWDEVLEKEGRIRGAMIEARDAARVKHDNAQE